MNDYFQPVEISNHGHRLIGQRMTIYDPNTGMYVIVAIDLKGKVTTNVEKLGTE